MKTSGGMMLGARTELRAAVVRAVRGRGAGRLATGPAGRDPQRGARASVGVWRAGTGSALRASLAKAGVRGVGAGWADWEGLPGLPKHGAHEAGLGAMARRLAGPAVGVARRASGLAAGPALTVFSGGAEPRGGQLGRRRGLKETTRPSAGGRRLDLARQAANVAGALFQLAAPILAGDAIRRVASEGPRSLVVPADYAFGIWGPIFLLSAAYALYQALPAQREDPLLRRVGWWTAGAYFLNGFWEVAVPLRQIVLAEGLIVGILGCSVAAYLRLGRAERAREGWLVALPIGLLAGWITAANCVSLVTTLVHIGLPSGGVVETTFGSGLLLLGGFLASAAVLAGRGGAPQGYLAYAAAVEWALAGVVVNQYGVSPTTTAAAVVSAGLVALSVLWPRKGMGSGAAAFNPTRRGAV